ncbi:COOH terminal WSC domain-containing protein [Trichoderma reesei QM6a]|uniref:COOH terminal WSC domain-containing protein n=2 Tax=Hypocrea jecorina TaxID=51453 RepID=G0R827_HYPJQ|nr:COOH terminal WSC domain-containing protein [Trichoderma reesei QM6a]EGR52811.1 COOH terminal WSC domain-containing protein [Trichoderma reesei QM6a]ETS06538.1 WSC-domain-containing protein [Trichoderma reesei RUT C-30]
MAGVAAAKDSRTFAVLRFTNKGLVTTRADPIVNPGVPSTHVHNVLGGSNFGFSSTGEDLIKSNCSTALVKGDYSNYWYPTLYFHDPKTGNFEYVDVYYTNVYYFFEATNDQIKAFPTGLQMLAGNSMQRTPPATGSDQLDPSKGPINQVQFTCPRSSYNPPSYPVGSDGTKAGMVDPNNQGAGVGFPDVTCDGMYSPLRLDIHFPSCYNPAAGLTNYKENMAYPTDAGNGKQDCPPGWIHTPHIFFEVYYDTQPYKGRWTENQGTQPFVFSTGDVTGYSGHADFMAGWDEDLLQHIIDTCDAGDAGMDQCPGLFYGLNSGDCTIEPLVDEQVTGTLTKLPGNNPLSGFSFGAAPQMGTGSGSSGTNNNAAASSTPQPSLLPPSPPPSAANVHTVTETVTVTAGSPAVTAAAASPSGTKNNAAASTVGGYTYAGCYQDNIGRVLSGDVLPNLGPMTNEKCVANCVSKGFSLAATEYGGQCYCGNELVGSAKLADSQCSVACEGNSKEICGGSWAISVYSKTGAVAMKAGKARRSEHAHRHRSQRN